MTKKAVVLKIVTSSRDDGNMSFVNYASKKGGGKEKFLRRVRNRIRKIYDYIFFYIHTLNSRREFFALTGINSQKIFCPTLSHNGNLIKIIRKPFGWIFCGKGRYARSLVKCDAVITNVIGLEIMFLVADCLVVTLFDPKKKVLGIVHAGRRQTIKNLTGRTVKAMQSEFDCRPEDIIASTSSHLCRECHFLTYLEFNLLDPEVKEIESAIARVGNGFHFDVLQANLIQLMNSGIIKFNESESSCTCCGSGLFSHRGWSEQRQSHADIGRHAVVTTMRNIP